MKNKANKIAMFLKIYRRYESFLWTKYPILTYNNFAMKIKLNWGTKRWC